MGAHETRREIGVRGTGPKQEAEPVPGGFEQQVVGQGGDTANGLGEC